MLVLTCYLTDLSPVESLFFMIPIINKLKTVGFPKNMGSALAGGNFDIITSMIHTLFTNFNVEIIEFK